MSLEQTPLQPNRRALVKGAAWATPVVAASTSIPAYAASRCITTTRFSGGADTDWGSREVGATRTNQTLTLGGQFWINNLSADVTVTRIQYEFWTSNRIGQDSPGPGFFWIGNGSTQYSSYAINATIPWTASVTNRNNVLSLARISVSTTPTAGSGFVPTVQSTQNLVEHTYASGATAQSWNLIMTWEASRDSNISSRYTASSTSGCRNFTTGPSGRFPIIYSNVVAPDSVNSPTSTYRGETLITVTLSNGNTITRTVSSQAA